MKQQQSRIDNNERDYPKELSRSRIQQFSQMIDELPVGNCIIFINAKEPIWSIMDVKQAVDGLVQLGKVGQNLEITEDELNYIEVHLREDCCALSFKQYADVILLEMKIKK